jgi:hypothetical protein
MMGIVAVWKMTKDWAKGHRTFPQQWGSDGKAREKAFFFSFS